MLAGNTTVATTSVHCGGNAKWLSHFGRQMETSGKLNTHLLRDPVISVLGLYPREMKTYVHTKTYAQMFIAALLIIAQNWKLARCLCTGEQNKQTVVYSHNQIRLGKKTEKTPKTGNHMD